METLTLSRTIPVCSDYDVIVAGGGPAGCAAAAAAAREGARTLLIEATYALGGMGTQGLVPALAPYTDKEKIIYRGFAERVLRACTEGMPHVPEDNTEWTPIDPELLKRTYDDMMEEFGVDVRFGTAMADVEAGDGAVSIVITADKSGLRAWRAGMYVDATGDGDLAAWAGADVMKGDEQGDLQAATLCFQLANVDGYAYQYGDSLRYGENPVIDRILASGKYPDIPDRHICHSLVGPGVVQFNAGHVWGVDNTRPETVSGGLKEGRRLAATFRDALAEFFPSAFGNAFLATTAPLPGIRETRRIRGDYVLTVDDYHEMRSFPDEICRSSYFIDVHSPRRPTDPRPAAEKVVSHRRAPGESNGVPYRCLTPQGLRNVLVAGRCISADRALHGSTRVMPTCLCTGEAAGLAAVMAGNTADADVHKINTDKLRSRLREEGAYLPQSEC